MLQNPIHLRLEKLESWQHVTFMACLCERMYPNYAMFCKESEFGEPQLYRRILDLIWETLPGSPLPAFPAGCRSLPSRL